MEFSEKTKKTFKLISTILSWIVVVFAVGMMIFTIVSVNTIDKNDKPIFGLRFYIVKTGSMSKSENNADMDIHFDAGDVVIIKNISDEKRMNLEGGEVIAFLSTNEDSLGETVTHMVREKKYDETTGEFLGYVTFGTNTGTNDEAVVEPGAVIGLYAGKLPLLGHFFAFLRTVPGYLLLILLPFLLIIGYNGVMTVKAFREYKGEQKAEIALERAELEEEKRKTEQMLKELQELKAQLGLGGDGGKPTDKDDAQE